MRHSTLIPMTLCAAAFMLPTLAGAQVFQISRTISKQLCPTHRAVPSIMDYNNDGKLDLFYAGQNFEDNNSPWAMPWKTSDGLRDTIIGTAWIPQAILHTATGDGNFNFGRCITYQWNNDNTGTAEGLPPSTYGKTLWLDFNNDGNLDALILGRSEYDWNPYAESPGDHWYNMLFQNNGSAASPKMFTYVNNSMQTFPSGNDEVSNPGIGNSNISFGDYNNDGYVDILFQCYRKWYNADGEEKGARYVGLFKNNGDGTFSEQKVFTPIAYDENRMPSGLFDINEETMEATPLMVAKPMSHGSAIFGDLNNDGYLDIITNGYSDDGLAFYIYKNNGDGTFSEMNLSDTYGVYEGDLKLADFNGDGLLDIYYSGTDNTADSPKHADILFNKGNFKFEASTQAGGNGLYGTSESIALVADFNHDGLYDVFERGWSSNKRDWFVGTFLQNTDGTFTLSQEMAESTGNSGGYAIGDINGDGTLDLVAAGYNAREGGAFEGEHNDSHADAYLGTNTDGATAPEAPTDVKAKASGKKITVSFKGNATSESYNVYVRNTTNGYISELIPANITTGKLLVTDGLQVALHSEDPSDVSYTVNVPDEGEYEVGVQTINPDMLTSTFSTATVSVGTGIAQVAQDANVNVELNGHELVVRAPQGTKVYVYDTAGSLVCISKANTPIVLGSRGVYLVKAANKVVKVNL